MSTDHATLDKATRRVGVAVAAPGGIAPEIRERIAQGFTRAEDVVSWLSASCSPPAP